MHCEISPTHSNDTEREVFLTHQSASEESKERTKVLPFLSEKDQETEITSDADVEKMSSKERASRGIEVNCKEIQQVQRTEELD